MALELDSSVHWRLRLVVSAVVLVLEVVVFPLMFECAQGTAIHELNVAMHACERHSAHHSPAKCQLIESLLRPQATRETEDPLPC
ncbi:hypothetical protein F441_02558 [Phytophthora nicotianae CJ01A1]|uniref:Uncharacterized protein n=3 Tax=Phytophthora nicotianae TaxID=4792 RepID=W2QSP6_PHYN3|nr:hypothetical protein PPTG_22105 [Phytophthora nicotianae INRA-310]ETN15270.1 hypothetical protein PPTG_22105 [Phytophthora nicotianae INRA-310]ETP24448.1 hypothetical protein F441_02558 [Phytophthora nicotianae CJ01A1]ETP52397.1 hypothetical protein F442_02581 [Phytophthora nicotianae P10297]